MRRFKEYGFIKDISVESLIKTLMNMDDYECINLK